MTTTALFAEIAALAGDPARVGMLHALMDRRAYGNGVGEGCRYHAQTASGHSSRMTAIGLLSVEKQGRHRYHRLEVPEKVHTADAIRDDPTTSPIIVISPRVLFSDDLPDIISRLTVPVPIRSADFCAAKTSQPIL